MKQKLQPGTLLDDGFHESGRMIPSWLLSLVIHGLMLLLMITSSHRKGTPEGSGDDFRDVGLVEKSDLLSGTGGDVAGQESEPAAPGLAAAASDELLIEDQAADASPAIALQLPTTTTLGAGPPVPTSLPATGATGVQKTTGKSRVKGTGTPGGGGGALGPRFGRSNGTSFFQVAAQGQHFYYVVDSSGSMDDNNSMGVARAELMASIERLDPSRRFQILFYDSELHPMLNGKEEIFFATDLNRTFARQFINNRQPDSGTMHFPALKKALSQAPDVIFFLTDGEDPELSPRELRDLKVANRNATQIHVVQFGLGAKLGPKNWLEQLAADHRGTYRYRDVTAFREK